MDGTLIAAWASLKGFRPKDAPPPSGGGGRNPEVDFHGERRLNQSHASATDPEARLFRQGKGRNWAIDGRTTRHPGYAISQRLRKQVEEICGWMKTVGNLRKNRHRGTKLVAWVFTLTAAAYNFVRIRYLTATVSP